MTRLEAAIARGVIDGSVTECVLRHDGVRPWTDADELSLAWLERNRPGVVVH